MKQVIYKNHIIEVDDNDICVTMFKGGNVYRHMHVPTATPDGMWLDRRNSAMPVKDVINKCYLNIKDDSNWIFSLRWVSDLSSFKHMRKIKYFGKTCYVDYQATCVSMNKDGKVYGYNQLPSKDMFDVWINNDKEFPVIEVANGDIKHVTLFDKAILWEHSLVSVHIIQDDDDS